MIIVAKFQEKCRTALQTMKKFEEAALKKELKKLQKEQQQQQQLQLQQEEQKPLVQKQETFIIKEIQDNDNDACVYEDEIPFEEIEYLEVPISVVEETSAQQHDTLTQSQLSSAKAEIVDQEEESTDMNDIEFEEIIQECESINDQTDDIVISSKNQINPLNKIDDYSDMINDEEIEELQEDDDEDDDYSITEKMLSRTGEKMKSITYRSRSNVQVIINHICAACGAGFTHISNLRKHLLSHSGTLHCESCVKFFDRYKFINNVCLSIEIVIFFFF